MKKAKIVLNTSGKGFWSCAAVPVTITDIELQKGVRDGKDIFGELRVYFDTNTWKTDNDGLIYTDPKFLRELKQFLKSHGLPGNDVWYSEQGMQDYNYVSLSAGTKFYKAWMTKFNIDAEKFLEVWYD